MFFLGLGPIHTYTSSVVVVVGFLAGLGPFVLVKRALGLVLGVLSSWYLIRLDVAMQVQYSMWH